MVTIENQAVFAKLQSHVAVHGKERHREKKATRGRTSSGVLYLCKYYKFRSDYKGRQIEGW